MSLDKIELQHAWAAGFFDGEGYIGANYRKTNNTNFPSLKPILTVTQITEEPLKIFKNLYGGSIYYLSATEYNRCNQWRWSAHSMKLIREILPLWLPYLVVKKEEALVALELSNLVGAKGKHSTLFTEGNLQKRVELVDELKNIKTRRKELAGVLGQREFRKSISSN